MRVHVLVALREGGEVQLDSHRTQPAILVRLADISSLRGHGVKLNVKSALQDALAAQLACLIIAVAFHVHQEDMAVNLAMVEMHVFCVPLAGGPQYLPQSTRMIARNVERADIAVPRVQPTQELASSVGRVDTVRVVVQLATALALNALVAGGVALRV